MQKPKLTKQQRQAQKRNKAEAKLPIAKLEAIWAKRLAASGFEDIEDKQREYLKTHSAYFAAKHSPESFEQKQGYYLKVMQALETHKHLFDSAKEVLIWKCYGESKSLTDTAKLVSRQQGRYISRDVVYKIRTELKKRLGFAGRD